MQGILQMTWKEMFWRNGLGKEIKLKDPYIVKYLTFNNHEKIPWK